MRSSPRHDGRRGPQTERRRHPFIPFERDARQAASGNGWRSDTGRRDSRGRQTARHSRRPTAPARIARSPGSPPQPSSGRFPTVIGPLLVRQDRTPALLGPLTDATDGRPPRRGPLAAARAAGRGVADPAPMLSCRRATAPARPIRRRCSAADGRPPRLGPLAVPDVMRPTACRQSAIDGGRARRPARPCDASDGVPAISDRRGGARTPGRRRGSPTACRSAGSGHGRPSRGPAPPAARRPRPTSHRPG
jgi:hypothetical protein